MTDKMKMPDVIYVARSKYKTINTGNWSIYKVPTSASSQKPIQGRAKEERDTYHHSRVVESLSRENDELKAKLDKAKDALRFYAFRERYHGTDNIVFNGFKEKQIAEDRGELARTTLEEIE